MALLFPTRDTGVLMIITSLFARHQSYNGINRFTIDAVVVIALISH